MTSSNNTIHKVALSRRIVIDTAIAVGDAEGLEAITLRRLARELGVTPMALYRYVEDKEDLLSGVAGQVFEEFELPETTSDDWREDIRFLGRSFRRLLVAHPMIATLYSAHPAEVISESGARAVDAVLGVLLRAGFPPRAAVLIERECERFILGLVMLETRGCPRRLPEHRQTHAYALQTKFNTLPAEQFPHLAETAPYISEEPDPEWAFEIALDLIVGGLEHVLEGSPSHLDAG